MLAGAVEVYSNHPVVIVGSAAVPEVLPGDADGKHVAVWTRGQAGLTRVQVWQGSMPMLGTVVFDGELDLDDGTICVGDIERIGRWTRRIDRAGVQRVVVRVDDPANASRVDVGLTLGADAQVVTVPSTGGPTLFEVLTSDATTVPGANELGLVLDGHDSPHARLRTALSLLTSPDPTQPWSERFEIGMIVGWLRWLGIGLGQEQAEALGSQLQELVRQARSSRSGQVQPDQAARIAAAILAAIP